MTNGTSTHGLAGGELTADGLTTHTIGFKIVAGDGVYEFTPFFDAVAQVAAIDLDETEAGYFEAANAVGLVWNQSGNLSEVLTKFVSIRIAPAGEIYE
jgi:hypothetical protein